MAERARQPAVSRRRESQYPHPPALDAQPALSKKADRLGIGLALLLEDALGQSVRCVIVENGNGALKNDGTVIVDVVGKVDGAAADLDAARQGRFVDAMSVEPLAAEGRDKSRMDVHNAAGEVIRDRQELKETAQADEIDTGAAAKIEDAPAEFVA